MGLTALLFALGLSSPSAFAQTTLDPAAWLSRFPAGGVPDTEDVHAAIDALGATGDEGSMGLLQSLRAYEATEVRDHAADAHARVARRTLRDLRSMAARQAPTERDLRAWILGHPTLGSEVASSEKRVVAYAAMVTREADWTTDSVGALTPEQSSQAVDQGEGLELSGRIGSALPLYVDAALSGDARAVHALMARGVDMQRLALGLSSAHGEQVGLPQLNSAPVVQVADPATVSVLITRAQSDSSLPRLAALENLGLLLRSGELNADQVRRARRALMVAARDTRPAVRRTAQSALAPTSLP